MRYISGWVFIFFLDGLNGSSVTKASSWELPPRGLRKRTHEDEFVYRVRETDPGDHYYDKEENSDNGSDLESAGDYEEKNDWCCEEPGFSNDLSAPEFEWRASDNEFGVFCSMDKMVQTMANAELVCYVSRRVGKNRESILDLSAIVVYLVEGVDEPVVMDPTAQTDPPLMNRAKRFAKAMEIFQVLDVVDARDIPSIRQALEKAWTWNKIEPKQKIVPRSRTVAEVFWAKEYIAYSLRFDNVDNHPRSPSDLTAELELNGSFTDRIGVHVPLSPEDPILLYPFDATSLADNRKIDFLNGFTQMTVLWDDLDSTSADYQHELGRFISRRLYETWQMARMML